MLSIQMSQTTNIPCDPPPPIVSLERPVLDANVTDDNMLSKFDRKQKHEH